mgnify:CR=1 FL=1|jgi:hypothetical protein
MVRFRDLLALKLFLFLFLFLRILKSTPCFNLDKVLIGYKIEKISEPQEIEIISSKIIKALGNGGEVCLSKVRSKNKLNLEKIFELFYKKSVLFYLILFETDEVLSWKLYSIITKSLIDGKEYSKKQNKNNILRAACSDIWKILFGSEITPFDSFLVYIKENGFLEENKYQKYYEIFVKNLFLNDDSIRRMKTSRAITSLSIINTKPLSSIGFSEITDKNVRIVKLTPYGKLVSLIDLPGTSSSICVCENDVFYIRSRRLFHCFYDKRYKYFVHEPTIKNTPDDITYASIVELKKGKLLCAKNYKIFLINYDKNFNGSIKSIEEEIVSPSGVVATNVSANANGSIFVTSEKIDGYYQLVAYDSNDFTRTILTNSKYNKQEPSISPCETYIAYTVNDSKTGNKKIEVVNIYTGKILEISDKNSRLLSPKWIVRKI